MSLHIRPSLNVVFVMLGLLVVGLSGAGLVVFRVYDNQLLRRTESELIAQGALVAAAFREELVKMLAAEKVPLFDYGRPVNPAWQAQHDPSLMLRPIQAKLDMGMDEILPPAESAEPVSIPGDPAPRLAGQAISSMISGGTQITLAGIRVVDHRGIVVATSREELGLSLAHREEVGRALEGEHVSLLRQRISDEPPPPYSSLSRDTGVRVFVAFPVVEAGRVLGAVVLSRTPMTLGRAFYQDRYTLAVTALILTAAVLAVSLLAARLIVRPIRALIGQTALVAAGDGAGSVPISHPGTRDVARLSEAFAGMARMLASRAEYIRAFATNVSHELKTPLTSIRGTVELLRDHGLTMDQDQRERFFANLGGDADRLERLVRGLLDLARADVLQPACEQIELVPVVDEQVERYRARGLSVKVTHGEGARAVRMTRDALEAVIGNLLENARQHGGEAVQVSLETRLAQNPGGADKVEMYVADDGPGISPANRARVFEAFFTTARGRGGTGLGLTIVRSLLDAHGGTIELDNSRSRGTVFLVRLPV